MQNHPLLFFSSQCGEKEAIELAGSLMGSGDLCDGSTFHKLCHGSFMGFFFIAVV